MTAGRSASDRARSVVGLLRAAAAYLAGVLLLVTGFLMLVAVASLPLGWSGDLVLTGSMTPRILPGDVVLTQPAEAAAVKPGQVILVVDPAHPARLLIHRVVERRADGSLITKGDANADPDSTPVPPSAVRGLPRLRLPYLGLPGLWLRQGRPYLVAASGISLLTALVLATGPLSDLGGPKRPPAGTPPRTATGSERARHATGTRRPLTRRYLAPHLRRGRVTARRKPRHA